MKKLKPKLDTDGDYTLDALVEKGAVLPDEVQVAIRNLLLACELGALVVVQCTRIADDTKAYVLSAYAETSDGDELLLPICELGVPSDMKMAFRPPAITSSSLRPKFVRLQFGDDIADLVPVDEGVDARAVIVRNDDDSIH